ncbi:MAG: hypothetical protein AB8G99_25275 [Planctomycetaceae bacterium]
MFRSLAILLFIGVSCTPLVTLGSDDIALVIVDSGHTFEWRKYHAAIFHEFGVVEDWRERASFEQWEKPPWFVLANRDGFQSQRAYTYRIIGTGDVVRTGLLTASGEDVFDKLIADDVALRNKEYGSVGEATVTGSRYQKLLTSPSKTYIGDNGHKVISKRNDLYIAYSDGIMAMGAAKARAFEFPFKAAKRLLRPAEGKTWCLIYRPQVVPPELRGQFLGRVESATGVRLQRADDEPNASYSLRRVISQGYLEILRSGIMDIEQAVIWTKWPRNKTDPFRGRVRVEIRPKTRLSKLASKLRLNAPIKSVASESDIGYVNLNVGLPNEIRTILRAYVSSFFSTGTEMSGALRKTIENETLSGSLRLRETSDGHPLLVGAVQLAETPNDVSELTELLEQSAVTDNGLVSGETAFSVFEQSFDARKFGIGAADEEMRVAISSGESDPPYDQSAGLLEQGREKNQPLVEVFVDLKSWLKREEDSAARKLLRRLETVWLRYGAISHHKRNMAKRKRNLRPSVRFFEDPFAFRNYDSLVGRGNLDGDWTFKATLKASASSITVDWQVGRDLHSYFLTREHVRWVAEE